MGQDTRSPGCVEVSKGQVSHKIRPNFDVERARPLGPFKSVPKPNVHGDSVPLTPVVGGSALRVRND
jgi:hypothetical protein